MQVCFPQEHRDVLVGLGLALGGLFSYWLSRGITQLTDFARRVAEGGGGPPPALHGNRELGILSQANGTVRGKLEGKTFVATNLAIAIAADPDSTALLVDLDLRAPRLHRRFGFEPDVPKQQRGPREGAGRLGDALPWDSPRRAVAPPGDPTASPSPPLRAMVFALWVLTPPPITFGPEPRNSIP